MSDTTDTPDPNDGAATERRLAEIAEWFVDPRTRMRDLRTVTAIENVGALFAVIRRERERHRLAVEVAEAIGPLMAECEQVGSPSLGSFGVARRAFAAYRAAKEKT